MSVVAKFDLPPMQAAFAEAILEGHAPAAAAAIAGYKNVNSAVILLRRSPAVRAAIYEGVQSELQSDAMVNLRVLREIRDDTAAPARVRADIGLKLMQFAGHVVPATSDGRAEKPLNEMTRDEMVAFIERNQAAIDRAEQELMSRAVDVTPAASVQDSVPDADDYGVKALDYLD